MTRRPRVLLVDDTPQTAELLSFALRDDGYDVAVAGFTASAGRIVARERAEAVVLNCSALDMSESLFDQLRGEPATAALPVVIIGDTPEAAVASLRARAARAVRNVPKPFTASQVAVALEQLIPPATSNDGG
jgi:DNA-binding response OmpR family regulator